MGLKLSQGLDTGSKKEIKQTKGPKHEKKDIRLYESPMLLLDENGQLWAGPFLIMSKVKFGRLRGVLQNGKLRWDYHDEPPENPIEIATPLLRYLNAGELLEEGDFNTNGLGISKTQKSCNSNTFWLREV